MITNETIKIMQQEVRDWCEAKGWYDKPVTYPEAMALLHSEVTEALEAWRDWGTDDATGTGEFGPPKPEGVGSEFADIFIRQLDDAERFRFPLQVPDFWATTAISESFPENMNKLHDLISRSSHAHADGWVAQQDRVSVWQDHLLGMLLKLCQVYGINLEAEYKRKMAYNYTRPYRHGRRGAI